MKIRNKIKRFIACGLLVVTGFFAHAQFIDSIYSYLPAPGQYTNTEQIGRPAAAESVVGEPDGLVSLGAYGGYIVVGFKNSIENDPDNPYGIDFTIFGNPASTWSEPGIIQVMRDDNGNGKPDDTWYEIAGSDHFFSTTKQNYQITYTSPGDGVIDDVSWNDNQEQSGVIQANSYHQQAYYPMSAYFPDVNTSELTFSGTLLAGNIDESESTQVKSLPRAFGYADNIRVISTDENLPDNPYTEEIEGSGGDAIDISWARDADGNYVDLDKIDFIRIYTGMNASAGWLGEISTEIAGIRDVAPEAASGVTQMIVIEDLPENVIKGDTLALNAYYFQKGRFSSETIGWTATPDGLVTIENGKLTAQKAGTVVLRASLSSDNSVYAEHELTVISAGNATIDLATTTVQKNDKLELTGKITDDEGNAISGMTGEWISGDTSIFTITEEDGQPWLLAVDEGEAWLYFQAENNQKVRDSVLITVVAESEAKKVYVSVKTEDGTIFPRQSLMVDLFDLNDFVDNRAGDYSIQSVPAVSVAHVLVKVFQNLNTIDEFRFRDDDKGNNQLYVWKVPETDDGSTALYYGYGGNSDTEAAKKTWLVKINQQNVVTGLDQTEINNGDEILLYHITDNSADWQFTQLTADNDSIEPNEEVTAKLMSYTCSMNTDRQVTVENATVPENAEISVDGGESETTDEFGQASFSFSQSGDYLLVSGIDQLKINVAGTTGIRDLATKKMVIYPNPANSYIQIKTEATSGMLEIFDCAGRLAIRQEFSKNSPVDISSLGIGLYLVRLVSGDEVFQQKIVKQ